MRNIGILPVVLVFALIVTACMPIQPQGAKPVAVGLRPDAPEYAKHGPFWVGYKPLVIGANTDQPLNANIWYPALNPNGNREEVTYAFTPGTPAWRSNTPAVVHGNALLNAPIDDSKGPYPLVIFSHGFGANAVFYNTLLEHLASYGFIVLK